MKYATIDPNGGIDVVYTFDPRPGVDVVEIEDDVFAGFVPNGNGGWSPPPPTAQSKDELKAYAASKRFLVETSGVTIGDCHIDTTRESQALITGAVVYVQTTGAGTVQFKAKSGWIDLTAQQVQTIATTVATFVQACFAAERTIDEAINAGTVTTYSDIDGWVWPTNP